MQDLISSGRVVDLILLVIVLEYAVLLTLRRARWKRASVDLFFALMPGAMLLLALRGALVGVEWQWIAGALGASFPFHLIDLARRRDM